MPFLPAKTIDTLSHDFDAREVVLRQVVEARLAEQPPPAVDGHIVVSYFFAFRTQTLDKAVAEIAYHATSGVKHPPPGSLLAECTAQAASIDPFDASRRIGLLHIAYPLKMMRQPDGRLTSCDILHTAAGAIVFDVYENLDARLRGRHGR